MAGKDTTVVAGTGAAEGRGQTTTVTVRCTGHTRKVTGSGEFQHSFEGGTLRDLLSSLFAEHPALKEMLLAETEAEATHRGWAPTPKHVRGTLPKNPEGEQTVAYARVLINGTFNERLDGFDTELNDGDRVALVYPFIFCC